MHNYIKKKFSKHNTLSSYYAGGSVCVCVRVCMGFGLKECECVCG